MAIQRPDPIFDSPVLYLDLVSNNDGRITKDGYTFTRTAIISGVTFSDADQEDAAIYDAIHDNFTLAEGKHIPQMGEPHPAKPACVVTSVEAASVSKHNIKLTIEYTENKKDTKSSFSVEADLREMDSNYEWNDSKNQWEQIAALSYIYKSGTIAPWDPNTTLEADIEADGEIPMVTTYIPGSTINYKRFLLIGNNTTSEYETDFETKQELFQYIYTYQGCINKTQWLGNAPKTWLCEHINCASTGDYDRYGNEYYTIDIRFTFKTEGHVGEIIYVCPYSGKIPDDVFDTTAQPNAAYSLKTDNALEIYRQADFNDMLILDFVDTFA